MPDDADFRPTELLQVLEEHGVRYVLIGGFAAIVRGSPHTTLDVDITPDRALSNLQRLSDAVRDLDAKVWTPDAPDGLPFGHDAASLDAVEVWNLVTRFGRFDISFVPSGTNGYADLHRDATRVAILGVDVEVASLADVIRSKEAADRPKDRFALPLLRRMLEEG